jgi:RNA polymerase sigma-70 factor (ECF subfamily)
LETVLARLENECAQPGRAAQFEHLKVFLTDEGSTQTYAEIGRRLRLSEGGVKSAVSRLRAGYRELVREAVAETVARPEEVEDELQYLFRVMSS